VNLANERLLDSLIELQRLDRVPRAGFFLRGIADGESVAEHSYQVALLVWALAAEIDGVDRTRALEIALIHDVAEVRFGDLPWTASAYLPPGSKKEAERRAVADLLAPMGDTGMALIDEYQAGESTEAKLVKACDKLQLMIKVALYERDGARGLGEFWENEANFPGGSFPEVRRLFDELKTWRAAGYPDPGRGTQDTS